MDGFAVPIEAVETNAAAAVRLAGVVGTVPLPRALTDLAAALPGSHAAQTAQTAQQNVQQAGGGLAAALSVLSERITWHADQLATSARAYRDADTAAAATLATALAAPLPVRPDRPR